MKERAGKRNKNKSIEEMGEEETFKRAIEARKIGEKTGQSRKFDTLEEKSMTGNSYAERNGKEE